MNGGVCEGRVICQVGVWYFSAVMDRLAYKCSNEISIICAPDHVPVRIEMCVCVYIYIPRYVPGYM